MVDRYVVLTNDRNPQVWELFQHGPDDGPISANRLSDITNLIINQRELNEPDNWLWRPDKFCVLDTSTDEHYWPVGPEGGWSFDCSDSFPDGPNEFGPNEAWAGWYGATGAQAIAIGEFLSDSPLGHTDPYPPAVHDQVQAIWDSETLSNCEIVQRLTEILGV